MAVTVRFCGEGAYKRPSSSQKDSWLVFSSLSLSPTIVDLGKLAPLSIPPIVLAYL
jgi:hypothetical protein